MFRGLKGYSCFMDFFEKNVTEKVFFCFLRTGIVFFC